MNKTVTRVCMSVNNCNQIVNVGKKKLTFIGANFREDSFF